MFDIIIADLDAGSYLCMKPKNYLAKVEEDKKYLYIQARLEHRRSFTPMIYSLDGIPVTEALTSQRRLATHNLDYYRFRSKLISVANLLCDVNASVTGIPSKE